MHKDHVGLLTVETERSVTVLIIHVTGHSSSAPQSLRPPCFPLANWPLSPKEDDWDAVYLLGSRHTWWFFCHQAWFWWCQSLFAAGLLLDPSNLQNCQESTCAFTSHQSQPLMWWPWQHPLSATQSIVLIYPAIWVFLRFWWIKLNVLTLKSKFFPTQVF